jgi:AcrR family transcriptional regulator
MTSKKLNRPKEPEASKEEFLQAALDLSLKKGFYATSVDDIVKKAGRSKGGFYHHFKSKSALYNALFQKTMSDMTSVLLGEISRGTTIREAIMKWTNATEKRVQRPKYLKAAFEIYFIALHNREARTIIKKFHSGVIATFKKVLEIGKARGELEFSEPTDELVEMIYNGNRGVIFMDILINDGRQAYQRCIQHLLYNITVLETTSRHTTATRLGGNTH